MYSASAAQEWVENHTPWTPKVTRRPCLACKEEKFISEVEILCVDCRT